MNSNDLDQLLNDAFSDHQSIEDQGFSENVMRSLPQRPNHKLRAVILLGCTSLGSLFAYILMGGSHGQSFLRSVFKGLATYQTEGLAMTVGVLMLYTALFLTTSEEIN